MKKTPAERFILAVGREIFCSRKQKRDFLRNLSNDISDYADTLNHAPSWDELTANFGTPSELAKICMQSSDLKHIAKANIHNRVMLCGTLCVVILLSIFVTLYIIDHRRRVESFQNGYEVETRYETVYTEDGLPPDEFYEGAIETITAGGLS